MNAFNALSAADLLGLGGHFALLSLLAVGGAITTASDMQRYVVAQHGWISDAQFTTSIAIAQAAPGPNVLFVAVIGWNVAGAAGALVTMLATMLPSGVLVLAASRWAARRRDSRPLRAFTTGMAPLTLGLVLATGWVLAEPFLREPSQRLGAIGLIAASLVATLRWKVSPMWLVGLGAVVGALGGI
jgi:chromate transporter